MSGETEPLIFWISENRFHRTSNINASNDGFIDGMVYWELLQPLRRDKARLPQIWELEKGTLVCRIYTFPIFWPVPKPSPNEMGKVQNPSPRSGRTLQEMEDNYYFYLGLWAFFIFWAACKLKVSFLREMWQKSHTKFPGKTPGWNHSNSQLLS